MSTQIRFAAVILFFILIPGFLSAGEIRVGQTPSKPLQNQAAPGDSIGGPLLGYLFDPLKNGFMKITGIPGASTISAFMPLESPLENVWISPRQDYALATDMNGDLLFFNLQSTPITPENTRTFRSHEPKVAFSPNGDHVAIYDPSGRSLQRMHGMPGWYSADSVILPVDISGEITALAIDDSGQWILIARQRENSSAAYLWDTISQPRLIYQGDGVNALAFFPGTRDAVLADTISNRVALMRNNAEIEISFPLEEAGQKVSQPKAIEISRDGKEIFIVGEGDRSILILNFSGGKAQRLECDFKPQGLFRLKGDNNFRLTGANQEMIYLLQATSSGSRIAFIPGNSGELPLSYSQAVGRNPQ